MMRNVAGRQDRDLGDFATLVCDVRPMPETYAREAPKSDPNYYFRPWKTMLVRALGEGDHAATVPQQWTALSRLGPWAKALAVPGSPWPGAAGLPSGRQIGYWAVTAKHHLHKDRK